MELCQAALFPHPAWDSLMLGSLGIATPQHSLQHQLEQLSLTPTQTELLLGTVAVTPRHTEECLGPSPGMEEMEPALWGLCSDQGTTPLDKAALKERRSPVLLGHPVRRIYRRMSGSSQRQHPQNNSKKNEYLQLAVKGAVDEGSQEEVC